MITDDSGSSNGLKALKERVTELREEVEDLRRWRITQETAIARISTGCAATHQEDERMRQKVEQLERAVHSLAIGVADSKAKLALLVIVLTGLGSVVGNLIVKLLTPG